MNIELRFSDRNKPADAVAAALDSNELLSAFGELIVANCTPSELYGEREIKQHCRDEYAVDDVYDEDVLAAWAETNGFVREQEA